MNSKYVIFWEKRSKLQSYLIFPFFKRNVFCVTKKLFYNVTSNQYISSRKLLLPFVPTLLQFSSSFSTFTFLVQCFSSSSSVMPSILEMANLWRLSLSLCVFCPNELPSKVTFGILMSILSSLLSMSLLMISMSFDEINNSSAFFTRNDLGIIRWNWHRVYINTQNTQRINNFSPFLTLSNSYLIGVNSLGSNKSQFFDQLKAAI